MSNIIQFVRNIFNLEKEEFIEKSVRKQKATEENNLVDNALNGDAKKNRVKSQKKKKKKKKKRKSERKYSIKKEDLEISRAGAEVPILKNVRMPVANKIGIKMLEVVSLSGSDIVYVFLML